MTNSIRETPDHDVRGLVELAERCEAATGPDRELDLAIELYLEGGGYDYPADNWPKDAPYYTASLDAAMTLTPEGGEWGVRLLNAEGYRAWCCAPRFYGCDAATPALALCAAALRARAALQPQQDSQQ